MGFFPVFIFSFLPSSAVTSPQDVPLCTDVLSGFPKQWDYILKTRNQKNYSFHFYLRVTECSMVTL